MKYKKIYHALARGGAQISLDHSGWRVSPPTYSDFRRPLWVVAEKPTQNLRLWVTHAYGELSVTWADTSYPPDSREYHDKTKRRRFSTQGEMADFLEKLLCKQEAAQTA